MYNFRNITLFQLKEIEKRKCCVCNKIFDTCWEMNWCSDKCRWAKETKTILKKSCKFCNQEFNTVKKKKVFCSPECRKKSIVFHSRNTMRKWRHKEKKSVYPCQVCGFSETVDIYREGYITYILCPNHHALVTRGIVSLSSYHISPIKC